MLIRNQTGDKLINLDYVTSIEVQPYGSYYSVVVYYTDENWDYIGEYATKEKALNVLKFIADEYQTSMYFPRIFAIPKEFEVVV